MISLGTVFHALAAVVLGWLVWSQVRMSADRDFMRGLLTSRIVVDWPARFLRRFCRVWGVPIEVRGVSRGEPTRMNGRALLTVHFHHGLMGIRVDQADGRPTVTIRLREQPADPESVLRHLHEALAPCAVRLET